MKHLLLIIALLPLHAIADTRVVISGVSHHTSSVYTEELIGYTKASGEFVHVKSEYHKVNFNENNYGLGIEHDTNIYGASYFTAGVLNDSFYKKAYYAGLTWSKRLINHPFYVDLALNGLILSKQELFNGTPLPVVLPMLSFGTNKIAANVLYVPPNITLPKHLQTSVLFLQFKYSL